MNTRNIWIVKGASLSDKSAREEYGISQSEIVEAIKNGELQYRVNNNYGNPYYKLIRTEVERIVEDRYGGKYLQIRILNTELEHINKELKKLKILAKTLEKRKMALQILLNEQNMKSY